MRYLFLAIFFFSCQNLLADEKHLSFLFLGQSNMAGQGKVQELSDGMRHLPKNVQFFLNGSVVRVSDQEKFGPEVSFAKQLSLAYPNSKIDLIKFAPGGSLMKDWLSSGFHYQTLKKQLVKISRDNTINLAGILWMQGERDTKSLEIAETYKEDLAMFIHTIRQDFQDEFLPFVIAEISIPAAYRPAVNEVRSAQRDLSREIPNVSLFTTDSLSKNSDNVHFNTQGQITLGRLFAERFLPRQGVASNFVIPVKTGILLHSVDTQTDPRFDSQ